MKKSITLAFLMSAFFMYNCKKNKADPHVPPDVVFKTGGKYVSADKTCKKQDTLIIGITATKTEDDLKSYNVSYAYDGASTTSTFYNYLMGDGEKTGYSKDVTIITRPAAGSEKWVFSIVDRDGNITQKTLNFNVQ